MSNLEDAMRIIDELGFPDDFTKMLKPFVKAALEAQEKMVEAQGKSRPFKVGDWVSYQYSYRQPRLLKAERVGEDYIGSGGGVYGIDFCRLAKPEEMFRKGAKVHAEWDGFTLVGCCEGYDQFMGTVIFEIHSAEPKVPCDVSFRVSEHNCMLVDPAPEDRR